MKIARVPVVPILSARKARIQAARQQRKDQQREREYRALYPHLSDAEYERLFRRKAP